MSGIPDDVPRGKAPGDSRCSSKSEMATRDDDFCGSRDEIFFGDFPPNRVTLGGWKMRLGVTRKFRGDRAALDVSKVVSVGFRAKRFENGKKRGGDAAVVGIRVFSGKPHATLCCI